MSKKLKFEVKGFLQWKRVESFGYHDRGGFMGIGPTLGS
jgi:hypothetical protein